MRKVFLGLLLLLAAGGGAVLLALRGQHWVLLLAAGIAAASFVLYAAVTGPKRRARRRLRQVDEMDGVAFEDFVADLLRLSGFAQVEATAATGDYGADLIARRDGRRYIFQCKRYGKTCGVKSVQEICGAKAHYASDVEVVVTNTHFTKNAHILAEETGVLLWDREVLVDMAAAPR